MKKENTAKGLMAVAMFIFGTLAPFVRNIKVSSGELALYRAVLAALLVGGYLLVTKQKLSLRSIKKELVLLLLSGVAMGINWIFLFEAYKYTTVSVATLSYYFATFIFMVVRVRRKWLRNLTMPGCIIFTITLIIGSIMCLLMMNLVRVL